MGKPVVRKSLTEATLSAVPISNNYGWIPDIFKRPFSRHHLESQNNNDGTTFVFGLKLFFIAFCPPGGALRSDVELGFRRNGRS